MDEELLTAWMQAAVVYVRALEEDSMMRPAHASVGGTGGQEMMC
jgi:hypothetical protein